MKLAKNGSVLVEDIIEELNSLGGWGSLEIYVQNNKVTQITKRAIKKTLPKRETVKIGKERSNWLLVSADTRPSSLATASN